MNAVTAEMIGGLMDRIASRMTYGPTNAYKLGRIARNAGRSLKANPYEFGTSNREAWERGWIHRDTEINGEFDY